MDKNINMNQMISQIEQLGFGFGEVTKIESPDEVISTLLDCLGKTFQCDRVYIFVKNIEGNYDCTQEWFADGFYSKKHLLQNLPPKSVKYYYNYFFRNQKVKIKDMEAFKNEDYHLYQILKPQNLERVICGQLVYDEQDMGFLGVDNPAIERFDELEKIFDIISYFLAIQIHKSKIINRVKDESRPVAFASQTRRASLFERIYRLKMEEPLAVIYCRVSLEPFKQSGKKDKIIQRMLQHTENVLSNIFGFQNVFRLRNQEFIVIFEDTDEKDLSLVRQYMLSAEKTLSAMSIRVLMGVAETKRYEERFFELVNRANIHMLRSEKKYRNTFLGKYHMQNNARTFFDLIEIHPKDNHYHVLYSEYGDSESEEGDFDDKLKQMVALLSIQDKDNFLQFWHQLLESARDNEPEEKEVITRTFSVFKQDAIVEIQVSVATYTDFKGERILICCTK